MTTSPAAAQRCVGVASGDHDGARAGARAARSAGGEREPAGGGVREGRGSCHELDRAAAGAARARAQRDLAAQPRGVRAGFDRASSEHHVTAAARSRGHYRPSTSEMLAAGGAIRAAPVDNCNAPSLPVMSACRCPSCRNRVAQRPSRQAAPGRAPGLSRAPWCRRACASRSEWCLVGSELRGVCRARQPCRVRATHPSAWCDDALRRRACDLRYRVSRHVLRCRSARCALCVVTEHARLRGHVASPRGTW